MSPTATPAEADVEIVNDLGLHARASAKFVKLANQFESHIEVRKDDFEVCGTSIMGLMLLAAAKGETIHIKATGADAKSALEALTQLIADKFEEGR